MHPFSIARAEFDFPEDGKYAEHPVSSPMYSCREKLCLVALLIIQGSAILVGNGMQAFQVIGDGAGSVAKKVDLSASVDCRDREPVTEFVKVGQDRHSAKLTPGSAEFPSAWASP